MGDFNLNWLLPVSGGFNAICDTYNLFQLVDKPTRPNSTFPEKSTLLDLVLTNAPHKYSLASVLANDIRDHCVVAVVRDIKMFKQKPQIITKKVCYSTLHNLIGKKITLSQILKVLGIICMIILI